MLEQAQGGKKTKACACSFKRARLYRRVLEVYDFNRALNSGNYQRNISIRRFWSYANRIAQSLDLQKRTQVLSISNNRSPSWGQTLQNASKCKSSSSSKEKSKKKARVKVHKTYGANAHVTHVFVNANEKEKLTVCCGQ
jgi:hypothetical protein